MGLIHCTPKLNKLTHYPTNKSQDLFVEQQQKACSLRGVHFPEIKGKAELVIPSLFIPKFTNQISHATPSRESRSLIELPSVYIPSVHSFLFGIKSKKLFIFKEAIFSVIPPIKKIFNPNMKKLQIICTLFVENET